MTEFININNPPEINSKPEYLTDKLIISPYFTKYPSIEIIEQIVSAVQNIPNESTQKWILEMLKLDKDSPIDDVRKSINFRIEKYLTRLKDLQEIYPQKIADTIDWLEQEHLSASQDISKIPVILFDSVFALINPEDERLSSGALFNPRFNCIIINIEAPNSNISHELGHAASYNQEKNRCGWNNVDERGNPINGHDNNWLNEGTTLFIEYATQKESNIEELEKRDAIYYLYFLLTKTLKEHLNISDHDFFQAYLSNGPERDEFEKIFLTRYGCSVCNMGNIIKGFNENWTQKTVDMLLGNPVDIAVKSGDSMENEYRKLANLFPNINLKIE